MKVISLNIAFGEIFQPLLEFIKTNSIDTDVFCFQEVLFGKDKVFSKENHARLNIFSEIQGILPDFDSKVFLAPMRAIYIKNELLPENVRPGMAILYRKNLNVVNSGGYRTYKGEVKGMGFGAMVTGNCQWIEIKDDNGESVLINHIHGIYQIDTNKRDTQARKIQSQIVMDFLESRKGKKVLVGDFNLLPDTTSIEIISTYLRNLISEYGITNTRSRFYEKPVRYADYAFVSKDIVLKNFKVLNDQVSDHLPLMVEFE
ncbi:endonuclease/exonuclease/phosphatase family protein [Candidatus Dojkabacteria bacterium]|nr:endonuclease/exonuclease/phosphatase family protein [Candidatus Dojkabacteria bacterium]